MILSWSAAADEQQCEDGWTKFQGSCYLHFIDREVWVDAENRCRDLSAHLVSIVTPEEQDFVNCESVVWYILYNE